MPTRKTTGDDQKELHFPSAGVDSSLAFDQQPNRATGQGKYARTTPRALNVVSYEPSTDRMRGGARPGLSRHVAGQVNGSNPIQFIGSAVVTSGTVPGSGTTVNVFLGATGLQIAPFSLYTFDEAGGLKKDDGTALFGTTGGGSVSARAFISGGANASYTSLGIDDGTGVAVALSVLESSAGVAQYAMAVNGKRFAASPATLPGTSVQVENNATVALESGSYHIVVGLQGGASAGVLFACGIQDDGSVNWSKTDVVTTSEVLNAAGYYTTGLSAAITGTFLCVYAPALTGVARCLLADGTSGSVIATKAAMAANAGAAYVQSLPTISLGQTLAATSAGVLAAAMNGFAVVDGVQTQVSALVFITASSGAFAFTAVTDLVTSPAIPTAAGSGFRQMTAVVTDGTHFYVAVSGYSLSPSAGYSPVIKKISGVDGSTLWTATLDAQQTATGGVVLVYIAGLSQLQVYGVHLSVALNATTGAVEGSGTLPAATWTAIADAGSLTLNAESVDTGPGSGPREILIAVAGGTGKVHYGGQWRSTTGGTSVLGSTDDVIRGTEAYGCIYFADGSRAIRYNPANNAFEAWTPTAGTLPIDDGNRPRLIALCFGRVFQSGLVTDPRNWFASRRADPLNWDYAPLSPNPAQAVAGNNSPMGRVGDVVTALIPWRDEKMIFGGLRSIWQMDGDPMDGGRLFRLTSEIGIAWGDAWCMDPYGAIYCLSNYRGIYRFVPGELPVRISQPIDDQLRRIDLRNSLVRLQWNDIRQGVCVFVAPLGATAATTTGFFFEARASAWWPMEVPAAMNPRACHVFEGNTVGEHAALIGSFDGYVRSFTDAAASDDGTAISSEVWIGPFLTEYGDQVTLKEIQAVLGESSGPVTWAVHTGVTAEAALASDAQVSGTFTASRNFTEPVRRRGHAAYIKLTASTPWAMEAIRTVVVKSGMARTILQ